MHSRGKSLRVRNIQGHYSEYCGINGQFGWACTSTTTPSNHDIGQGVAAPYNLVGTYSNHRGYISQYVYTTATNSGTSNVLFRYGHKTVTGNVGVAVYPAGLAVEPRLNTETLDYVITFSW